jgi:hypothetical protein
MYRLSPPAFMDTEGATFGAPRPADTRCSSDAEGAFVLRMPPLAVDVVTATQAGASVIPLLFQVVAPGHRPLTKTVLVTPSLESIRLPLSTEGAVLVRGRVVDAETGQPVRCALEATQTGDLFTAPTAEDGSFAFHLAEGPATLRAKGLGLRTTEQALELRGATADVTLSVRRASSLAVRIRDAAGRPVLAHLTLRSASLGVAEEVTCTLGLRRTDTERGFKKVLLPAHLSELPAGSDYVLTVERRRKNGRLGVPDVVVEGVALERGRHRDLDVLVDDARLGSVELTALTPSGAPLAKRRVRLLTAEETDPERGLLAGTDDEGRARFDQIPAGTYRLEVEGVAPSEPFELAPGEGARRTVRQE